MSRARTTWNPEAISHTAAMPKKADPYLMNQDHVSQNPRADKYMNGTPSSWAEDVHTPNEWEKEYSGGQTKRNEIGLPETRPETFNHPEHAKSASNDLLVKKADLAVKVARMFLPTAAEAVVEDQAVSLMALSDADLIETHNRLAQDQGQEQGQQAPKDQQQQATTQPVAQGQQDQGQQAPPKDQQQQAGQQDQGQQEAPKDQGQQQAGMQQQSAAYQAAMQQCMEAMGKGDQQGMQAAIQQMVQEASQADFPGGQWGHNNPVAKTKKAQGDQGQGQGQGQQQQKQQAGMQDQQAMVQQMVQQAVQQMQQVQQQEPGQEQGQQGQAQDPFDMQASDDQLLDNMLAPATAGAQVAADPSLSGIGDIQLDAPIMDTGDVQLGPEDDVLKDLFASQETEDAQHAQQQQSQQHQASTVVRTAATRTVGTRPSAGVSRVGGAGTTTTKTAGTDVDKLSSLWASAPDVREHFGI